MLDRSLMRQLNNSLVGWWSQSCRNLKRFSSCFSAVRSTYLLLVPGTSYQAGRYCRYGYCPVMPGYTFDKISPGKSCGKYNRLRIILCNVRNSTLTRPILAPVQCAVRDVRRLQRRQNNPMTRSILLRPPRWAGIGCDVMTVLPGSNSIIIVPH